MNWEQLFWVAIGFMCWPVIFLAFLGAVDAIRAVWDFFTE